MRVVICVILVLILLLGGCTLNFKGKDIEMDGTIVLHYELDSIDFFSLKSLDQGRKDLSWKDSISPVPFEFYPASMD